MMKSRGVSLPAPGTTFKVRIDGIDDEGRGRGHHPSITDATIDVAVRGAFPGDIATVTVEKVYAKRQLLVGRASSIITPGDCREPSACPHASPCPACPLETAHTSFALQLKRAKVERVFQDAGIQAVVEDVKSDLTHRFYRQKIKLMVTHQKGKVRLGLFRPGSHHLQAATHCALVRPALNALALEIQKGLNTLVSNQTLTESQIPVAVFLREGRDGLGGIFVCDTPLPDAAWQWLETLVDSENILGFGTRIRSQKSNSIVGGQLNKSIGSLWVLPLEGGTEVHIDTFCQANPSIAQRLYRDVAHFMVGDGTANEFLDLYAGNGGFGNALKQRGATHITAVESHPLCEKPLKNVGNQVHMESTEAWLEHTDRTSFDALVADPPKKGLGHAASKIAQLQTPRVALVFCNPDAIAKDVPEFLKAGYGICAVVPYDLFGGTPEVETVVYLTKDCNI